MLYRIKMFFVIVLMLASLSPVIAQEMPPLPGEELIGGLDSPRGIAISDDGVVYVAIAGVGGDVEMVLPGPDGESLAKIGLSGRIIAIDTDGNANDFIMGMPSVAFEMETLGLYRAIPQGNSIWLINSGSGSGSFGNYFSNTISEIDMETLRTITSINLSGYEHANDPDGLGYDTNVADIAWGADGTMYIVDAGANALLSWTEADGLSTVTAWANVVPTSVEVAENGDLYVGFLGEGLAPGAGVVEHWSGGELVHSYGGMTAVTDILLDGDTVYAVELFNIGEEGPGPGRVVMVTEEGPVPVVEGLIAPFAIAMDADGAMYITYGTIAFAPGMTGGVVKVEMDM